MRSIRALWPDLLQLDLIDGTSIQLTHLSSQDWVGALNELKSLRQLTVRPLHSCGQVRRLLELLHHADAFSQLSELVWPLEGPNTDTRRAEPHCSHSATDHQDPLRHAQMHPVTQGHRNIGPWHSKQHHNETTGKPES